MLPLLATIATKMTKPFAFLDCGSPSNKYCYKDFRRKHKDFIHLSKQNIHHTNAEGCLDGVEIMFCASKKLGKVKLEIVNNT